MSLTQRLKQRRISTIAMLSVLSLVAAGCSQSKVSQCRELIDVINTAVTDLQTVTQSPEASNDPESLVKIAEAADRAVGSMQTVELKDEELQAFQQRFITMYTETGAASRAIYDAVNSQNPEAAQQAVGQLEAATNEEEPLVNEVNTYCTEQQ